MAELNQHKYDTNISISDGGFNRKHVLSDLGLNNINVDTIIQNF